MLAVVATTGIPGLATSLSWMDHTNAAAEALVAEAPLAVMMAAFGALVASRARWAAILVLAVNVGIDLALGVGLAWHDAATKTGPLELVLAMGGSAVAAIAQTVLALGVWALASWLSRAVDRMKYASALLALSIVHVVVKAAFGGSVIFGALGAASAIAIARGSAVRVVPSAILAIIACGLQARSCARMAHTLDVHHEPMCTDEDFGRPEKERNLLARLASKAPNVDDAASALTGDAVTLYVLRTGGGALDPATKSGVEKAIAGARCVVSTNAGYVKPSSVAIASPTFVTADVTMRIGDPSKAAAAEHAVRDAFDAHNHSPLIHVLGRGAFVFMFEGEDPANFFVGDKTLNDYLEAMPSGSVLVIGRVSTLAVLR